MACAARCLDSGKGSREGEVVATVPEIISAMREAAPAGRQLLAEDTLGELQSLTRTLTAAKPDAVQECHRFEELRKRCINLDEAALSAWLRGKSVLVTGGTGCLGSILLAEVMRFGPGRLVSVSRGQTSGWPAVPEAEYRYADVTDRDGLREIFREVQPDVVFHMAAQRDPGRAELEVALTVSTNVFGTRNVAELAEEFGVADVICATTGKALRPYSREVYTAAKRSAEWMLARAAVRSECRSTAVRFTHVVDNSIVYDRLLSWANAGVIRLHEPGVMFYAQSGLESAQLMLCAGLGGRQGGLRIYAINDLGWPIGLLELAVGTLQQTGSASPIYLSGHDPGYETVAFPGLYDPLTAGDVSPLLSAFEAIHTEQDFERGVDACSATHDLSRVPDETLARLELASQAGDEGPLRAALDELSWQMLEGTLAALPLTTLRRAAQLTEPYEAGLSCDHRAMLTAIRQHGTSQSAAVA
jgi:nucleoside-diphosphate-sugar epimerase